MTKQDQVRVLVREIRRQQSRLTQAAHDIQSGILGDRGPFEFAFPLLKQSHELITLAEKVDGRYDELIPALSTIRDVLRENLTKIFGVRHEVMEGFVTGNSPLAVLQQIGRLGLPMHLFLESDEEGDDGSDGEGEEWKSAD